MNYASMSTTIATLSVAVGWVYTGVSTAISDTARTEAEAEALKIQCDTARAEQWWVTRQMGTYMSPGECGLDVYQTAVSGLGALDAGTVWIATFVGLPVIACAGQYMLTSHLHHRYYSEMPLTNALDEFENYANDINKDVCEYYLEKWTHLLTELKTNDPSAQLAIASLLQGYYTPEKLNRMFTTSNEEEQNALLSELSNRLLHDMADQFTSLVKKTLQDMPIYTGEEIDRFTTLKGVCAEQATKLKRLDAETYALFMQNLHEGKRNTFQAGRVFTGLAGAAGGMAASMFTNSAGFAAGGLGAMTRKVAGMAMMGPSGIALGKKKTMRKQKKGRKGSKKQGKK
jgi:hypothetical protein